MDDLRDTIEQHLGGMEELASKIPGYSGYKAKETRREADKLLRMEVARQFDEQRRRLADLQVQLISTGQIEYLDDVDRAVTKLQGLVDRIKTASYGYAGLFDAVKVKEQQLDALYEYDNALLEHATTVESRVNEVHAALDTGEGIGDAIRDVVDAVSDAARAFNHRNEAILQASTDEPE
jgi:methyl-accepting chemotaxis protein